MVTKAAARQNEFTARVQQVLLDADEVGKATIAAYVSKYRGENGYVVGTCGGAMLLVKKPTYRLRKALQSLNRTDEGGSIGWLVDGAWSRTREQAYGVASSATKAAFEVVARDLEGEGTFSVRTYID